MQSKIEHFSFRSKVILTILSALLFCLALTFSIEILGLVCMVPFLLPIQNLSLSKSILISGVLGLIIGCVLLFWMFESIGAYTGGNSGAVAAIFTVSLLTYIINYIILGISIWKINKSKHSILLKSIAIAFFWIAWEIGINYFYNGTPWFHSCLFKIFLTGDYVIQLSVYGGSSLISLFCILINVFIAQIILNYKYKPLWVATVSTSGTMIALICAAYIIYPKKTSSDSLKIAVLTENFRADLIWNEQNGDSLVNELLELNKRGVSQKPDIMLWTESFVPWSFLKSDPFVTEILKESSPYNIYHILGMNSDYMRGYIYNSAYFLKDTSAIQRYDKRFLLTLAEKQLSLLSMPSTYDENATVEAGVEDKIFETERGKIGVLICNETLYEQASAPIVSQNIGSLLVIANDAWFASSKLLLQQHFGSVRLRAVENRINTVVNSNLGYSGHIDMMGNVLDRWDSDKPECNIVHLEMIKTKTIYSEYSKTILYIYIIITLTIILTLIFKPITK